LADIATNIKSLGVVPNDVSKATANAIAINNFFATNTEKTLLCTPDNYYIDDTIVVTGRNQLLGQHTTKFILTVTNKDAFRIKPFSSMEKLSIELPANHIMSGVKVGSNDNFMQWSTHLLTYVRDIFIYGNVTGLSTGLKLDAATDYNVSNFTAENVTILNCYYGIYVKADTGGWANGNNFINVYPMNCYYGIYNLGNANKFIYSVQIGSVSVSKTGVFTGGIENVFVGKVWDVVNGQYLIETDYGSQSNQFIGQSFASNLMQLYIKDRGTNNTFTGDKLTKGNPTIGGSYRYSKADNTTFSSLTWSEQHYGILNDSLAFADKTATITQSTGDNGVSGGYIGGVFNNDSGIIYKNTSVGNPITIELVLAANMPFTNTIGISFGGGNIPKNVKIEYATTTGEAYSLGVNVTENQQETVTFSPSAYGASVRKLKFTLSDGIIHTTINPNGLIWVSNIFAYQNGSEGNFLLSRKGGKLYGNLDLTKNKLQNAVLDQAATVSRPTAPVKGQMFYDTTLNKPIWYNGTAWTDATGTSV
jgi:hypothetical protein